MIDENCAIYKQGRGYCWCPSRAWNLKDQELCRLCQVKNAHIVERIRYYRIASLQPAPSEKMMAARAAALAYE